MICLSQIVLDKVELECQHNEQKPDVLHRSKEQRYFFDRIFTKASPTSEVYAYVGATEIWSEANGATKVKCAEWVNHPEYIPSEYESIYGGEYLVSGTGPLGGNDYAVCRLESPVDIDTTEVYLDLNDDPTFPIGNEMAQLMGMGQSGNIYDCEESDYLLWGENPILDQALCEYLYWGLDNTMVCDFNLWSAPRQAVCYGDSGGPVIIETEDPDGDGRKKHTVVGIVSWGAGYCGTNPDVHARVSSGVDWIRSQVCDGFGVVDASLCEGGGQSGPVELPNGDCDNNPLWRYKGDDYKDCGWVALRPSAGLCQTDREVARNCPLYCSEDCACVNKPGAPCDWVGQTPGMLCREPILATFCRGVCDPACS